MAFTTIQQKFTVPFHYPVSFTTDLFSPSDPLFRDTIKYLNHGGPAKVLFFIEEKVDHLHPHLIHKIQHYLGAFHGDLKPISMPVVLSGGEPIKNNPALIENVNQLVHGFKLCRHSFIVAIGGGAFIDAVGYIASISHRGIRHIRIPTTVLSQSDAAIGVKNSINYFGKKNYLGTFTPPAAVLVDFSYLKTLEDRDWLGGISESIKVALLKDIDFFQFLEEHVEQLVDRDIGIMKTVIYRCAKLHLEHIANHGDPFETGSARPLDFGHWAAHKLEQLSKFDLHHGEAVAIGISLDTTYSYLIKNLPKRQLQRILNLFLCYKLPIYSPFLEDQINDPGHPNHVLLGLEEFRQHLGGELAIFLLEALGKPMMISEIDDETMMQSIKLLKNYHSSSALE